MTNARTLALGSAPSHVAVLVPSVHRAAERLSRLGFAIGPEREFASEGTREIYVEGDAANSLLLMEPVSEGPYRRAFDKRGPGFHHFAIDVLDAKAFVSSIAGSGWLLHPKSLETLAGSETAYLARPGFPALIEVQSKTELTDSAPFVEKVHLRASDFDPKLIDAVGLTAIVSSGNGEASLTLRGTVVSLSLLF